MNLPNALTISRLVAIPPLMFLLLARFDYHDQVAAAIFIVRHEREIDDPQEIPLVGRQGQLAALHE